MILPDAGTLFVLLIRVTAILAVAWMVARSRWCGSAAIRHVVWFFALGTCLLIPVIGNWLPAIHLPIPRIEDFPRPEALSPEASPATARARTTSGSIVVGASAELPSREAVPESRHRLADVNWGRVFTALWLTGGLLRLAWLALLHSRNRRLTNRARALNGHYLLQPLADEIADSLRMRRPVPVLATPEVRMPLAWGLFRPVILLPVDAFRWSVERLRIVLLHELAHVRRWDYGTSLLSELVCILYWPTPLVWLARRQVRAEQERACDDRVLALGTPPLAYADHILAIARDFYGSRWELEVVVTMAREVSLKQRVRAILDDGTDRRPLRSPGGFAVSLAVLGLYLPLTAIRGDEPEATAVPAQTSTIVPSVPPIDARSGGGEQSYLWLEAEAGVPGPTALTAGDLDASNAEYVLLEPASTRTAKLRLGTELAAAGEYFLWARVSSPRDRGPWSLRMSILGGNTPWSGVAEVGPGDAGDDWHWLRMMGDGLDAMGPPGGVRLPAGRHLLELTSSGGGVRVDRVLLTSDAAYVPDAKGAAAATRPTYILVEGEDGARHGRIRSGRDSHASAGSFVVFREGRDGKAEGTVEYEFDVPSNGRFLIWGRAYAEDEESNSLHLSLDGGPEMIWDLPATDERDERLMWVWDPVSARTADGRRIDPVAFDIERGRHTLRVRTREGGGHLDALLLTSDLENRPDGLWPEALPARPAQLELRAEAAHLSGPMALRSDVDGGLPYLAVGDQGRAKSPGGSGLAAFEFEAPETGLYSIWARTVAPSSDQDSFWIRVNGGEWTLWNGIPRSFDWSWAPVRDAEAEGRLLQLHLDPGRHTLEIAGREGGLRLDRLLVTNDPLFRPS